MSKLTQLHENFINRANEPMNFDKLPIKPQRPVPVIVPINKWEKEGTPAKLTKQFSFRRQEDRVRFVSELLEYELNVGHHSSLLIDEENVMISLITHGAERITELDKEYSLFADSLYKDIVYSP